MYRAALILEGGALRGQYTAGVLDTFLKHDIHFELVVGVSAGALCGTNYLSEQIGRTNTINTKHRQDKNYISLRRAFKRQDIINLDYLFAPHSGDWENFDERTYRSSTSEFVVVATALASGQAVYFRHPQGRDLVADLKASSAMPFISAPAVTNAGVCLDGGIADSIPFAYAQKRGFDQIVVVRTRERTYRKNPTSAVLRRAYQHSFAEYPAFASTASARPEMYNQQAAQLQQLEQQGQVFVIAPQEPVTVGRLERDVNKLTALHQTGMAEAEAALPGMQAYLSHASED
ncbi:MAG: patatin family protein [Lactobacillus sp.]|jgi:predicted patatin/cPLA2 family phospholipase|uniref:Patatin family protein n=1 Tax=Lacticaseibacillus suilingensis TaxID=2799577 RepID=A0ABW4BGV9_9LACO|nr:patatin family protein [Lacticaseibacillus suilingensis]MCI1894609.1 patatin family protein [Lactobacillus sp.]MCI1918297.1 patatin family protein [Lactobacillus sp.]MCI1940683.1 patatin family protein [Lactobacillus sp.]MCI1971369.1 patatin family protein [Lactobacillus sp.]MCI2017150.1 patatin family protein [Lactobacillus sp.]